MTEAMPFLQKYDITFLRPLPILERGLFTVEQTVERHLFKALSPQKKKAPKPHGFKAFWMVETAGLEPVTSTMRMSRSPR